MRIFIAIEINYELKAELGAIQEKLRPAGADAKWVKPENIHLTLRFIGEIDEQRMKDVNEAATKAFTGIESFSMSLGEAGAFPDTEYPRVLWVGIKYGATNLKALADRIEKELVDKNFGNADKPFSPHMTIARLRTYRNAQKLAQMLSLVKVPAVSQKVENVSIIQSSLTPSGPIYTNIHKVKLKTDSGIEIN